MEIKYFKLIKTITEQGSIANSADKLFLTQSALSHQLKELENRLGFKVFNRKPNQWELTKEGQELYKLGNDVLSKIEKGLKNIEQLKEGTKGTIKISTECYSFYYGLPKLIQKIGLLYPNITIELSLDATHKPISKILDNEINIALVTSPTNNDELTSVKIYEDEIFCILHKEHPLANKSYIEATNFSQEHLIIHSYPLETVTVYEQFLKPSGIIPTKITAIPLTEVAIEMIAANMGITCMPKWALQSFKLHSNITLKKLGKTGFKRTHYLVFKKTDASKKYVQDFVSSVHDHFTDQIDT